MEPPAGEEKKKADAEAASASAAKRARFTPPRSPMANDEPWRYVLGHETTDLGSYCALCCVSRSLGLRAAKDKTTDTLRWKFEFERRFPWGASSWSQTFWDGEDGRVKTYWRTKYLRLARGPPTPGAWERLYAAVDARRFDEACKLCEVDGADTDEFYERFISMFTAGMGFWAEAAAEADAAEDDATAEACGRFVTTVLAADRSPLPDELYNHFWIITLMSCIKGLQVPVMRAILTSRRIIASNNSVFSSGLATVARIYTEVLPKRAFGIAPPPHLFFLEGQTGVGRPWTLRGLRMTPAATRRAQIAIYARWSEIGELIIAFPGLGGLTNAVVVEPVRKEIDACKQAIANLERSLEDPDWDAYVQDGMDELWADHMADIM